MSKATLQLFLEGLKARYWRESANSISSILSLNPASDTAAKKIRALGMIVTALNELSADDLEKLAGMKVDVQSAASDVPVLMDDLESIMVFFKEHRASGDIGRHSAIIFSHLEEAWMRIQYLIRSGDLK